MDDGDHSSDSSTDSRSNQEEWEGVSLEELGDAYAKAIAMESSTSVATEGDPENEEHSLSSHLVEQEGYALEEMDEDDGPVTPAAIIEAALFVGHPENRPLKPKQLAGIIRDVSPNEVQAIVDELNVSYQENGQAFRIAFEEGGYRLDLAPELDLVRRAFYGKVRDARLSHGALEVLALVAYQPGIAAARVQDQRGKESGSLLSQLVRRKLIEVRRETPEGGGRSVSIYFPTERFLKLFDLHSLEDLPQVDDADVSPGC